MSKLQPDRGQQQEQQGGGEDNEDNGRDREVVVDDDNDVNGARYARYFFFVYVFLLTTIYTTRLCDAGITFRLRVDMSKKLRTTRTTEGTGKSSTTTMRMATELETCLRLEPQVCFFLDISMFFY